MGKKAFPEDFLWGASTSSHQVEGGTYNQWTVWELEHAGDLAKKAPQTYGQLANWNSIKVEATNPENYVSGLAVDHFNKYETDFDIAQALNLNAFRFSVEWSRIEPEEGQWDRAAIEHYRRYILALKARGLEPVLNIWHWTNPVWFEAKGGFERWTNLGYFHRYAAKLIEELGDDLKYAIILNEPNNYAWYSYLDGRWPPQKKSWPAFLHVYMNLLLAHRKTYQILKHVNPNLLLTSSPQLSLNVPKDATKWQHRLAAWIDNWTNNWLWLKLTRKRVDFIGFNNYFKNYTMKPGGNPEDFDNPAEPVNDLGWYMEPTTIEEITVAISQRFPEKPLMVTENGVADAADAYRKWWLEETMKGLEKARAQGANLIGYIHWSLLDNFEWADGWWPKFGLVAVDRDKNMKRTVRPSAKWWARWLKAR